MTTQTTTSQPSTTRRWARLGVTAASLTVLGGALLWQIRQGGDEAATPVASSRTESRVTAPATPLGGIADARAAAAAAPAVPVTDQEMYQAWQQRTAPVSAAVTPTRPTNVVREDAVVYLVSSPEQADRVQADIDAARAFVAEQWISLPQATVLVVGTPEDEARAAELLDAGQYFRLTTGHPALRVVDLRLALASAPPLDPAAFSDQELYSRWLQAQAAAPISALGGTDAPYATTPVSNCESFVDRFAC